MSSNSIVTILENNGGGVQNPSRNIVPENNGSTIVVTSQEVNNQGLSISGVSCMILRGGGIASNTFI